MSLGLQILGVADKT